MVKLMTDASSDPGTKVAHFPGHSALLIFAIKFEFTFRVLLGLLEFSSQQSPRCGGIRKNPAAIFSRQRSDNQHYDYE